MTRIISIIIAIMIATGAALVYLNKTAPKADVAPTAAITVNPAAGTKTKDENFTVDFMLDTGGQSAVTVGVGVSYSSNLEFVSFDENGSDFNAAITNPDPKDNTFKFERWRLDGGYNGNNGVLLKVTFKPKETGPATITINRDQTNVFDSVEAKDILNTTANASFDIAAPPTAEPQPGPTTSPQPVQAPTITPTSKSQPVSKTTTQKKTVLPAPSPELSTIELNKEVFEPNLKDIAILTVTIKDTQGKILSSDDYKPQIQVDNKDGLKGKIEKNNDNSWSIKLIGSQPKDVITTIASKNIVLGQKTLVFAVSEPLSTDPTTDFGSDITTTDPSITEPIEEAPAPVAKKTSPIVLIAGIIGVLAIIGGVAAFWFIRHKKSVQQ